MQIVFQYLLSLKYLVVVVVCDLGRINNTETRNKHSVLKNLSFLSNVKLYRLGFLCQLCDNTNSALLG